MSLSVEAVEIPSSIGRQHSSLSSLYLGHGPSFFLFLQGLGVVQRPSGHRPAQPPHCVYKRAGIGGPSLSLSLPLRPQGPSRSWSLLLLDLSNTTVSDHATRGILRFWAQGMLYAGAPGQHDLN